MTTILIKKKDTAGAPAAGDLTNAAGGAEIAVNTATKRVYTKDSGGNVVEVGTNPTATTMNGSLTFVPDATYDIGATGATRPRDIFMSRNLTVGGTMTVAGGINFNGNVTVGDASTDTLTINSTITSNLIFTDNTYDIGASGATRPRNLFLAGNATIGGAQTLTGALTVDSTTDSTSTTTGSIQTDGGLGVAKALFLGTNANVSGNANFGNSGSSTYGGYATGGRVFSLAAAGGIIPAISASTDTFAASTAIRAYTKEVANDTSYAFDIQTGNGSGVTTQKLQLTWGANGLWNSTGLAVTGTLTSTGDILLNGSGNPSLTVKTSGAGNNPFIRIQADTNYWDFQSIFSAATDDLDIRYNGASKLNITSAGNVGIGNTNPGAFLDVGPTTGASQVAAILRGGSGLGNTGGLGLYTNDVSATARNWGVVSNSSAYGDFSIRQGTSIGANPLSAGTDRFYISNTGDVNIGGTEVSIGKVVVKYTSNLTNPLTPLYAGLNLWGDSSVRLLFGTNPASPYGAYIQASNTGSGFPICLNPSGGGVSIGTNAIAGAFTIGGSGALQQYFISTSGTSVANAIVSLCNNGSSYSNLSHDALDYSWSCSGTARFSIQGSGILTSLATYNNTSAGVANMFVQTDGTFYRGGVSALKYKQDIRDLELIDINKFRAVRYKSKCEMDDQTIDYFGIIADEVDAAGIKELVVYGADGEVESFMYERLTVVLLKNLQSQKATIESLKARLDAANL